MSTATWSRNDAESTSSIGRQLFTALATEKFVTEGGYLDKDISGLSTGQLGTKGSFNDKSTFGRDI